MSWGPKYKHRPCPCGCGEMADECMSPHAWRNPLGAFQVKETDMSMDINQTGPVRDWPSSASGTCAHIPHDANPNDGRAQRYIEALSTVPGAYARDADYARAVMAVADAEQAELLAKVARVEALLDEGEMIWPDAPEWAVDGVREFTERLRAAMNADA